MQKRPSAAGAQLSEAPAEEAELEENPAQGKAHRAGNWGSEKQNSAESPRGSASDSRRPPVKVGGPRSYGWRDMPNKILIPLRSLFSCFLDTHTHPRTGGRQWAQLGDSGEATLRYVPTALSAGPQ